MSTIALSSKSASHICNLKFYNLVWAHPSHLNLPLVLPVSKLLAWSFFGSLHISGVLLVCVPNPPFQAKLSKILFSENSKVSLLYVR